MHSPSALATDLSRPIQLDAVGDEIRRLDPFLRTGHVAQVVGLTIEADGPAAALGDICEIERADREPLRATVAGFRNGRVLLMPLDELEGVQLGDRVLGRGSASGVRVGDALLGRVLDGFGAPMDGGARPANTELYPLLTAAPGALEREPISERVVTGVRVIDGFLPCGRGQRMGIFGGSGVGKSTLLGSMTRNNDADVTVIALIGERNREVRDFLEHELSPEARARSVVVAATSDRPAPLRVRACFVALAVAEYFRDQGKSVLLVIDSVTRLAMAQREIGLAAGEPPSQKGYTPSVFAMLPKVFERAGNFRQGSITGFFTVLVEGDDFNEPICDAARGILDGHMILSRKLGTAGHFPAIDVLQSVSRLTSRIATKQQQQDALTLRQSMALYQQSEDLIRLGAYSPGSDPALDAAIRVRPSLMTFLRQRPDEAGPFEETLAGLAALAKQLPA
jgi:flagellum-specific ATP synthase